jgi:hypothetical protein
MRKIGETFKSMSFGQDMALLLVLTICNQAFGQPQQGAKAQPPDRLIEAHRYQLAAKQELDKNCSLTNARGLVEKAIQTGRAFRSANQLERDMVGTFLGDTEVLRMNILERQKAVDQAADQAESLLKQHKATSAGNTLQQAQPPSCESRFKNLAGRIQQAETASEQLMRQGDEVVNNKPMKAMSYYSRARDVNVEVANYDQKMTTAQNTKQRLGQHTTGHKVLIVALVVVLLGGLGYAASKQKKQGGN